MPKSWKVPFILIVTAVSTISSMLFNPGIEQIEPLFSPLPFGISLLTLGFLLPIVIYIIAGVKRKRRIRS